MKERTRRPTCVADWGTWLSVPVGTDRDLPADCAVTRLDGGDTVSTPASTSGLPVGVHTLLTTDSVVLGHLAVVPERAAPPPRAWALSVLPRSLRSAHSWGVGDFADLARLAEWCADRGVDYLFLGPTAAGRVRPPVHPSPYSPSSRLFHDLLLIHPPSVPGWSDAHGELRRLRAAGEGMRHRTDRLDDALELKLLALRILFEGAGGADGVASDSGFLAFRQRRGTSLRRYALHCAVQTCLGSTDSEWPEELRTPEDAEASDWAAEQFPLRLFFEWCQWQLEQQLCAAADRGVGLVRDLPVGTPPDSADAWAWQSCGATGWELGAPGDYFNPEGHGWGLLPLEPAATVERGMEPFRSAVRATMEHAAGIRIDHALGLGRQFWIPAGDPPTAGHYVAQPLTAFADVIAIEAHRAGVFVVTEEMGTPAPMLSEELRRRGFLDYAVVMSDEFSWRSSTGVVSATTHDLSTSTGCWTGADEQALRRAGIPVDPTFATRARERLAQEAGVSDTVPAPEMIEHLYRRLGESESAIVVVPIEDLLGIERRPNAPGSGDRWPSFVQPVDLLLPDGGPVLSLIESGR